MEAEGKKKYPQKRGGGCLQEVRYGSHLHLPNRAFSGSKNRLTFVL